MTFQAILQALREAWGSFFATKTDESRRQFLSVLSCAAVALVCLPVETDDDLKFSDDIMRYVEKVRAEVHREMRQAFHDQIMFGNDRADSLRYAVSSLYKVEPEYPLRGLKDVKLIPHMAELDALRYAKK